MIEFKDWDRAQTDKWYLNGTKIAYIPLGEEAYALILVTPWQSIYLEEIPLYGGEPQYWGRWCGTVEEAVEFVKKEWT